MKEHPMPTAPAPAAVMVVTPTLGTRTEWLRQSVASLHEQGIPFRQVVVSPGPPVAPSSSSLEWVSDPGCGLTGAVNAGVTAQRGEPYLFWLSDDDYLLPGGLRALVAALDACPDAVAAMGRVRVVDARGRRLFDSPHPRLAIPLLPWGPGGVFIPSVLLRSSAVRAVGGLDASLEHAADLDLLLRLRVLGPIVPAPTVVASFRWHTTSKTVADPANSLREAEAVRRRYHRRVGTIAYLLWRPLAARVLRCAKSLTTALSARGPRQPADDA